jgi:hypothetical protein
LKEIIDSWCTLMYRTHNRNWSLRFITSDWQENVNFFFLIEEKKKRNVEI